MMFGKMDAKKKALEELMGYLDKSDDKDLGDAANPKGVGIEVAKVQGMDDKMPDDSDPMSGDMSDAKDGGAKSSMSDEEIQELIEALQSKLGS